MVALRRGHDTRDYLSNGVDYKSECYTADHMSDSQIPSVGKPVQALMRYAPGRSNLSSSNGWIPVTLVPLNRQIATADWLIKGAGVGSIPQDLPRPLNRNGLIRAQARPLG